MLLATWHPTPTDDKDDDNPLTRTTRANHCLSPFLPFFPNNDNNKGSNDYISSSKHNNNKTSDLFHKA
jgi:hypothetical protein